MKTKSKQSSNEKGISQKDWDNILELYDACMENAIDLVAEAELLYQHKYFARSLALALFAYEEIGKGQIVADLFNDMVSKEEFEQAFKNHEIKSAYNARNFAINTKSELSSHIDYDKTKGRKYTLWRMTATYVDCLKDYKAQEPKKIVTENNAREAIDFVKKEIHEIRTMEFMTERVGSKSFMK